MVAMEAGLWHIITPDGHNAVVGDVVVPKPPLCTNSSRQYNCLLESRGELLWALIEVETCYNDRLRVRHHRLSLLVHALEEEDSAPKKTMRRWVRKDGKSLADRVLFLGWPNSFVVDASLLGCEDGSCAYFAYSGGGGCWVIPRNQVGVYRFNLVSNKVEFIDRLPREWIEGRSTWIIPQPVTTPIQVHKSQIDFCYRKLSLVYHHV
jgi:hypothetical protein